MEMAAIIVVSLVTLAYVGAPLLAPAITKGSTAAEYRRRQLLDEKERLLNEIKDLDLEQMAGKLSQEDFTMLKNELNREAALVLQALDESSKDLLKEH